MGSDFSSIVGILDSPRALQGLVDDLETRGFDHAQFGVLASDAGEGKSSRQVARDPNAPTQAVFEPESEGAGAGALIGGLGYVGAMTALGLTVLSGGALGVALAAAAVTAGAGGLVGLLVANGFHHEHAQRIDDQLSEGGLVLWVQPLSAEQEALALAAFERAGAHDITRRPGPRV